MAVGPPGRAPCPADGRTDRQGEGGRIHCARDAFGDTSAVSVTHCGSHAQPADAVTVQKQAPVERYERKGGVRGVDGDGAAFAVSVPGQGGGEGGRQLCIVCRC